MGRGRKPNPYDNKTVARWLIEMKYKNLDATLKTRLPGFVHDAVYGGLYIYKGDNTKPILDVAPEIIYRCLMMFEISTEAVRNICEGFGDKYSERTLRRIAQIARFVSKGIELRIEGYEVAHKDLKEETDKMFDGRLESQFLWCYKNGVESKLYSPPLEPVPEWILQLRLDGKYLEYGEAVREFRVGNCNF